MVYKNNDKMKFFGDIFIKNNKNNCFLLINDKINELYGEYNFNKKTKYVKIKLIETDNIENMSFMFYDCISLLSVDMTKWNINNVKYLDYMFANCSSLNSISDISKWDITNVIGMNCLKY